MSAFVEIVERATVSQFATTSLPHQGRAIRWLDILAWLSRDQYCRYRHPLQWRTAWTESGTVDLHDEDASVLIRLVMDLLDQDAHWTDHYGVAAGNPHRKDGDT